MLRSRKFRPFERVILFAITFLLIGASVACAFLAFRDRQWRLGFAGGGGLTLADRLFLRRQTWETVVKPPT